MPATMRSLQIQLTAARIDYGAGAPADEGDTIIAAVKSDARYNPPTGRIDMTSILQHRREQDVGFVEQLAGISNQAVLAETRTEVFLT